MCNLVLRYNSDADLCRVHTSFEFGIYKDPVVFFTICLFFRPIFWRGAILYSKRQHSGIRCSVLGVCLHGILSVLGGMGAHENGVNEANDINEIELEKPT